jgi:DNA-directed RNA polymerase
MIHDSYGTHAGKAGLLFTTVREVFVQTYTDHDVLQELYEQVHQQLSQKLCEKLPVPPKKGTLDLEQVKQSLYAFA